MISPCNHILGIPDIFCLYLLTPLHPLLSSFFHVEARVVQFRLGDLDMVDGIVMGEVQF